MFEPRVGHRLPAAATPDAPGGAAEDDEAMDVAALITSCSENPESSLGEFMSGAEGADRPN